MIKLYGIPNCDTVSKARKWLASEDIEHVFHNFKKDGLEASVVKQWLKKTEWSLLLNKRGTTYRKLSDEQKAQLEKQNVNLLVEYPSLIKRPVWEFKKEIAVGFKDDAMEIIQRNIL